MLRTVHACRHTGGRERQAGAAAANGGGGAAGLQGGGGAGSLAHCAWHTLSRPHRCSNRELSGTRRCERGGVRCLGLSGRLHVRAPRSTLATLLCMRDRCGGRGPSRCSACMRHAARPARGGASRNGLFRCLRFACAKRLKAAGPGPSPYPPALCHSSQLSLSQHLLPPHTPPWPVTTHCRARRLASSAQRAPTETAFLRPLHAPSDPPAP